ncbi:efflux RND transporter periplasmic adaptor subunit [Thermaurantiacus sp.]
MRALLPVALLLASCSQGDAPASEREEPAAPVPVLLHRAGPSTGNALIIAPGTVRLRHETPLAFWTAGRVASVNVRQGDRVRAGQELARLDTRTLDMDVRAAQADARRAREELKRQETLLAQGWVPRVRVDTAAAAAGAADAALERALFAQKNAIIRAPADGIVLERLAEPGQTVAAGEPVLLVGEYRSGFVLRVPLVAADAARVRVGMPAQVRFPDASAPPTMGQLIEIAGRADERTGTFQVEVALPANPSLKSGQLGEVRIAAEARSEAPILLPATALFGVRAGEGFVWRFDPVSRKVEPVRVETGAVSAQGVTIEAGLRPGDLVVRSGVDRLTAGQRVVPATPAQARRS